MSVCILVVDDEEDVADLFKRRFRRELKNGSYTLDFALSGNAALEVLKLKARPEVMLILSDINMPGMSGLELLGKVKEILPLLPIVMITAYGDDENRKHAKDLGASEFLTKPVNFDELRATIAKITAKGNG